MIRFFAASLLLAGCPLCPSPQMTIVSGSVTVAPGAVVDLRASYGDWQVGPGRCGGHWTVNLVEGGDATVGTIDTCGRYTAPATFPDSLTSIDIEASEYPRGQCSDCCPFGALSLTPQR
jgi:hypothetical protein